MRQNTLSIHSENILPIIKKWLYSEKEIFLRELVSNATDALNKAQILGQEGDLAISIRIDRGQKTLTISDSGIGMTEEEVEKYIAQIAFSGAEEFAAKYQKQTEKDPIIGHFGLGFYSAYMVARKVEIQTLSYQSGAKPVFWSCDGGSSYEIGPGQRAQRGTDIILHLDEQNLEYLEEAEIRRLLKRYCSFLPFPIDLNGQALGNRDPLWLKAPSECQESDYRSLYRQLFPLQPDPIFWIHLNIDYPFRLQGILYFPKTQRRLDPEKSSIQLYCNRVFVSDSCKEILPDYLMMLCGAIDSPDIPLNVSRSYLQVDQKVRQLSAHISKKVADKLIALYKSDKEAFIAYWPDIEWVIKLGLLQDEKFYERIQEVLLWKTSEGTWRAFPEIAAESKKILYTPDDKGSALLDLYRQKKQMVLFAPSPIDTAVIQLLEKKQGVQFQRIDGALEDSLLDPSREKTLLDAEGKSESACIADVIQKALATQEVAVEAKSLASDALPAFLLIDESERRLRDYLILTQGKQNAPALSSKKTFVVNTNHALIQKIRRLADPKPAIAAELARSVYDLALLSQKEAADEEWEPALARQRQTLEKLAELIEC